MSEGGLPAWFGDIADVLSVLSVFVTFWLGYQAKNIKEYFFNRVRIGEIIPQMDEDAGELLRSLRGWEADSGRSSRIVISRIKGQLINLNKKLGPSEKKPVTKLIAKIENTWLFFFGHKIHDVDVDRAWEIATDYAAIVSQIKSVHHDARWRQ